MITDASNYTEILLQKFTNCAYNLEVKDTFHNLISINDNETQRMRFKS